MTTALTMALAHIELNDARNDTAASPSAADRASAITGYSVSKVETRSAPSATRSRRSGHRQGHLRRGGGRHSPTRLQHGPQGELHEPPAQGAAVAVDLMQKPRNACALHPRHPQGQQRPLCHQGREAVRHLFGRALASCATRGRTKARIMEVFEARKALGCRVIPSRAATDPWTQGAVQVSPIYICPGICFAKGMTSALQFRRASAQGVTEEVEGEHGSVMATPGKMIIHGAVW